MVASQIPLIPMNYFKHPTAIIDEPAIVGEGTQVWLFAHICAYAQIGSNCILGQNVFIDKHVRIGNRVKIQNNVSVYEGVTCEDEVFLGPSVVFTNILNPRSVISRKHAFVPTLIKKGATIGANATIICGNEIGEYAMIGAGTVVTKPVVAYALITGNPGSQKGWVSEYGHTLMFDEKNKAVCPESGQQYLLSIEGLKKITP
jgi:UDP-2-acetamido-3-amino-2,3-dideoxy-glucuronate N-acetyltransferase